MVKLLRGEAPVKIPIQLITIQRASYREGASLWQRLRFESHTPGFITSTLVPFSCPCFDREESKRSQ